ncbi:MAG: phosphopantothenate synthase, partial [Burkholderiales bacterium]|nr:phosphopantothenate synthase [Burkholderiales bacterium]
EQACGDKGDGRLKEPKDILEDVIRLFTPKLLEGKKVLITAGPTFEPIDPVRGITNHSSGKQGFDIALQAARAGGQTVLVAGPVTLQTPEGVKRIDVVTAKQMKDAVLKQIEINRPDLFIGVAAVCDWGIANPSSVKLKKQGDYAPTLQFTKNPDILATVAALRNAPVCIGFAAETNDITENAETKLKEKGVALIVANHASAAGKDTNNASFIDEFGVTPLGDMTKLELAQKIIERAAQLLAQKEEDAGSA